MNKIIHCALLSLLLSVGASGSARADDACADDRQKFCADAKGPAAKMACMKSHEAELSNGCKAQRDSIKQAVEEVHADCKPDVAKLCPGIQPGGGRIMACMKQHEADLSPSCKRAVETAKELKESIHPGCHADVAKLCPGIQPGGGRIMACLEAHKAQLSPACQEHVAKREANKAAKQGAAQGAQPAPAPTN